MAFASANIQSDLYANSRQQSIIHPSQRTDACFGGLWHAACSFVGSAFLITCLAACVECRIALEAAAASPAAAILTASCLNGEASPLAGANADPQQANSSCRPSMAANHVASLLLNVEASVEACWLAVSEAEKLQPRQCQALLDTFFCDALFCQDSPQGLRQGTSLSTHPHGSCSVA